MADASERFTIPEVARLLTVSTGYARRELRTGLPPTIRLGRSVREAPVDVDGEVALRRERY
ncbi:MAG TPA: hypothetical protein VMV12_03820 [Candidatus Micrarchaeaceae archaeon]|nr:hypothetical protein [Candidatus Micrarchaeaceae archaeon]